MHQRYYPQGLCFERIGNQVFTHQSEPERLRGEIRASVALIGKWNQRANGGQNFRNHPVGGIEIIRTNEFPNLVKVSSGFRMESRIRS